MTAVRRLGDGQGGTRRPIRQGVRGPFLPLSHSVTCSKAQLSATLLALRSSSASGRPRPRLAPAPASRSSGSTGQPRLRLAAGGSIRLGPGRGLSGGFGPMLAPLRRLPRRLPAFLSFLHAGPPRTPAAPTRPRAGPAGCCGPFKTLHNNEAASTALYPPPCTSPAARPYWPPPSASKALLCHWWHWQTVFKPSLLIRYMRSLSFRGGPIRAFSERNCQSVGDEANQSGRTPPAPRLNPYAEFRGGPWVHSQHSSPAPLGLARASGAAGAAPTHGFVY